jgi:hypothetical protein
MKILCVSLGRNGTQSFSNFLRDHGITTTHFYKYDNLPLGSFSENEIGILDHFETLDQTDAHVDIPTCLIFDKLYEQFPDAKYINITRPEQDWVASMIKMRNHYVNFYGNDRDPYIFEEAYCNFYENTGKKRIQDLTEEELISIRSKHLEKVNEFFKDKANYLEVELSDPQMGQKIMNFIGVEINSNFPNDDGFRPTA